MYNVRVSIIIRFSLSPYPSLIYTSLDFHYYRHTSSDTSYVVTKLYFDEEKMSNNDENLVGTELDAILLYNEQTHVFS